MCVVILFFGLANLSLSFARTLYLKGGKNWSRYFYPCYRRCCAGGGGAAQWGWFWPAYSSALLPEHAGADRGQREDRCSVCCPVDCCRIHQHPALPHWEDLWCGAGTQKGIRRKMDAVPGVKPHITCVFTFPMKFQNKFFSMTTASHFWLHNQRFDSRYLN